MPLKSGYSGQIPMQTLHRTELVFSLLSALKIGVKCLGRREDHSACRSLAPGR